MSGLKKTRHILNSTHLCRLGRRTKVVSYLRYGGRASRMAAIAVFDPGCVKTCLDEIRRKLSSLF